MTKTPLYSYKGVLFIQAGFDLFSDRQDIYKKEGYMEKRNIGTEGKMLER